MAADELPLPRRLAGAQVYEGMGRHEAAAKNYTAAIGELQRKLTSMLELVLAFLHEYDKNGHAKEAKEAKEPVTK